MMQQDEEVGRLAAPVPVIVAKLTEIFLTQLVTRSGEVVEERGAKTLTQQHPACVIRDDEKLDFLKSLVKDVRDAPAASPPHQSKNSRKGNNKTSPVLSTADADKEKTSSKQNKTKETKNCEDKLRRVKKTPLKKKEVEMKAGKLKKDLSALVKTTQISDVSSSVVDSVESPSCGRVLNSHFTITNLLNTNNPQIIISQKTVDLDEDYD